MPKPLVIGLGNPILGDDGVGWAVAREIDRVAGSTLEVEFLSTGGLDLMERMLGRMRVVVVDAVASGLGPPGTIHEFGWDSLPVSLRSHLGSTHQASLGTALAVGRATGADLPTDITIVGVEITPSLEFSEALTPEVEAAVHPAACRVLARFGKEVCDGVS